MRTSNFGDSVRSIQRFHLSASGKTGGLKFCSNASAKLMPAFKAGALTMPTFSTAKPVQSPEFLKFSNAVGSTDATIASAQTAAVRNGQRKNNFTDGSMASVHGSSSVRLLN